jgi:hypothetical protein
MQRHRPWTQTWPSPHDRTWYFRARLTIFRAYWWLLLVVAAVFALPWLGSAALDVALATLLA